MATSPPTKLGVAPNLAGLLCYTPLCCTGLVFSVVAVILEKENRFVRFHAFQSLLVHAVIFVAVIVVQILVFVVATISGALASLVSILGILVGLAGLVVGIFLMIKAYNGEEYALPTL